MVSATPVLRRFLEDARDVLMQSFFPIIADKGCVVFYGENKLNVDLSVVPDHALIIKSYTKLYFACYFLCGPLCKTLCPLWLILAANLTTEDLRRHGVHRAKYYTVSNLIARLLRQSRKKRMSIFSTGQLFLWNKAVFVTINVAAQNKNCP
jgi:hypothetical protein